MQRIQNDADSFLAFFFRHHPIRRRVGGTGRRTDVRSQSDRASFGSPIVTSAPPKQNKKGDDRTTGQ
jgi:hypothetical protein